MTLDDAKQTPRTTCPQTSTIGTVVNNDWRRLRLATESIMGERGP